MKDFQRYLFSLHHILRHVNFEHVAVDAGFDHEKMFAAGAGNYAGKAFERAGADGDLLAGVDRWAMISFVRFKYSMNPKS